MSKASDKKAATNDDGELDAIADELYLARPDAFVAARDEQVAKLRAGGRQALARQVAGLHRPTQSAWMVNALWRDQRAAMEQLFQLADVLKEAQANASGAEFQRLTAVRRELDASLLRRARALTEEAGVAVTAAMERETQETLAAALAVPEIADQVRTGRLTKPVSYAGFGAGGGADNIPFAAPRVEGAKSAAAPAAPAPKQEGKRSADAKREEAERDRQQKRREEAELRVSQASERFEKVAAALAEDSAAAEEARERQQRLETELQDVRTRLKRLEAEFAAAQRDVRAADRHRESAEEAHEAARDALDRAEKELAETMNG